MSEDSLEIDPWKSCRISGFKFSPFCLALDKLFKDNPILNFLRFIPRILSKFLKPRTFYLSVRRFDIDDGMTDFLYPCPEALCALATHQHERLLEGNDVETSITIGVLLTWCLNDKGQGLLEIYSLFQKICEDFKINIDDLITLPAAFSLYRKSVYIPPPYLISVI